MIASIAGGVGGAKMAHGLELAEPENDFAVIVNTADDFTLYGLHISPDVDTVIYTLAGIANPVTGWGIKDDTFNTLDGIASYGERAWFTLGDRDFATHILRTERLGLDHSLSDVTAEMALALRVKSSILPMSDDPVHTVVQTPSGNLAFQDYFVRRRQEDDVVGVVFEGIDRAKPTQEVLQTITSAELVILCPSNPIVSIGPILALSGLRPTLIESAATKVAVSPLIGGKAVKGPADRMMTSMGLESSAVGVATLYRDVIDGFVIDNADADAKSEIEAMGIEVLVTDTMMRSDEDRRRLASETLDFSRTIARSNVNPA